MKKELLGPVTFHTRRILHELRDQDYSKEGMIETPERYARFLYEFLNPPPFEFKTFEEPDCDEMIVVKDIHFYSMCEHHLVPFFGTAAVAYVPRGNRIVGISKLPRAVDAAARAFTNQERIGKQVAQAIQDALNPLGVAVYLQARHLCMEMRGIKAHGASTVTTTLKGCFKEDVKARAEFFKLVQ